LNPNPKHEWWQLNANELEDAFYRAFENADAFEDLPDWAQTAILEAEKKYPHLFPELVVTD
jgi:hypothetical protein